jgi:long-chain acyl-CoA synthetase
MNLGIALTKSFLRRPTQTSMVDDMRSYRGVDLMVAGMHIADQVDTKTAQTRVGMLIPTSGIFAAAAYGIWLTGRTAVPMNYLLDEPTLNYIIQDSGCDLIIASRKLIEHIGFIPKVKTIVYLEDINFASIPSPRLPKWTSPEDLAVVLYTSGTSGKPKGVMLSHRNLLANAAQLHEHIHVSPSDVFLGVLPQFHSFGLTGLTLMPMLFGCKAVYAARFVPKKVVGLIKEHRPTIFLAIPSMYNAMLTVKNAVAADFDSFRIMLSGGEPLPEDVRTRFAERFNQPIVEAYGLTETAPGTNVLLPSERRAGTVGRALPGIIERIIDPATDQVLPHSTDGELRIKGPNVMQGYLGLDEETKSAFDKDGFFKTGDMAQIDADGFLKITGRIKEMMIVGGENVFPREIEEVLNAHPAVHDSGVVGQVDPMRGEVPLGFVELEEDQIVEPDELVRWCRDRLPGYKVPRRIELLDALPRNGTGKIMRRALSPKLEPSIT